MSCSCSWNLAMKSYVAMCVKTVIKLYVSIGGIILGGQGGPHWHYRCLYKMEVGLPDGGGARL